MGLSKLAQEDPSFHFTRDEETNQTVIEGMGELHLDIIVDRLRREYKVQFPQHLFVPSLIFSSPIRLSLRAWASSTWI